MRRRWLSALVLGFPLSGCASLLWPLERSLVFQPYPFPAHGQERAQSEGFEDVWFHAADDTKLHGWYADVKEPRAVVLYHHGNAGNVTHRDYVLRLFRDRMRCSVLVYDYRGFGKSEGSPDEKGILADARAARRWLARRTGVGEQEIVQVGNSLGGGVAVDLAADGARGLVLENTFSSLPEVAQSHFFFLPTSLLMSTRLDSETTICKYRGPLLQTHGDADDVVPFELGKKLFAAAREPKQFIAIPGGGHNELPKESYLQALEQFLESLSVSR